MEQLYSNIKKFRELKNLTREQMAAKVGLSVSGYSKIERGEIDLTISRIQLISKVLQVDLDKLLNFDAAQIFNISNNNNAQSEAKAEKISFNNEDVKDKYIKQLENEIERLKSLNK
jgi:transcriptional regulator with XRE-family HTH domain